MHCVLTTPSLYTNNSNNKNPTGSTGSSSDSSSSGRSSNGEINLGSILVNNTNCGGGGSAGSSDHNSPSPTPSSCPSLNSIPSSPNSASPTNQLLHNHFLNPSQQQLVLPLIPSPTTLSFSTHFIKGDNNISNNKAINNNNNHNHNNSVKGNKNACVTNNNINNNNNNAALINAYLKPIVLYPDDPNNSNNAETLLPVECGPNSAILYLSKLCQGSKGQCICFNGCWLTPNEFQYISGRETAKDWKRSIRHNGKSIKLLISKGVIRVHSPICECGNRSYKLQKHYQQQQHQQQQHLPLQFPPLSSLFMGTSNNNNNNNKSMELLTNGNNNNNNNHHHSFAQSLNLITKNFTTAKSLQEKILSLQSQRMIQETDNNEEEDSKNIISHQDTQQENNCNSDSYNTISRRIPNNNTDQQQSCNTSPLNNNNNNIVIGSVKRETRLTSIIDHLLISRTNAEEHRNSAGIRHSRNNSPDPELLLPFKPTATSQEPIASSTTSSATGGDSNLTNMMMTPAVKDATTISSTTMDEINLQKAGTGRKSSSSNCSQSSSSSSLAALTTTTTTTAASAIDLLLNLAAASTDSTEDDQQDHSVKSFQSNTNNNNNNTNTTKSTTKSTSKKNSRHQTTLNNNIKNERQSPESVRSSPSPKKDTAASLSAGSSSTSTSEQAIPGGGPPASPPLKQMEQMMSRNYSDFMRSLAAKYNHSNPNDLYPAARSSSFAFDTRFLKPGAAAAAASLLAFQQQSAAAADKIPFPLIDMSSTQTLLSMVRSAAIATSCSSSSSATNNLSGSTPTNNNNRATPNSILPTTPPMNSIGGLKRPSSPLDLSSAAAAASAHSAGLFLNHQLLPKKMKQMKRCGSSCSGCSNEAESIVSWTVDDVCNFVSSIDLCAEYVQAFRDHSIDGTSLPLLTEDHLIQNMNMKLGPALKFKSSIAKKLGNCPICIHCVHCHINAAEK